MLPQKYSGLHMIRQKPQGVTQPAHRRRQLRDPYERYCPPSGGNSQRQDKLNPVTGGAACDGIDGVHGVLVVPNQRHRITPDWQPTTMLLRERQ